MLLLQSRGIFQNVDAISKQLFNTFIFDYHSYTHTHAYKQQKGKIGGATPNKLEISSLLLFLQYIFNDENYLLLLRGWCGAVELMLDASEFLGSDMAFSAYVEFEKCEQQFRPFCQTLQQQIINTQKITTTKNYHNELDSTGDSWEFQHMPIEANNKQHQWQQ